MQDIVFYAAVNETQGIVRDSANARNLSAPILVLGVSACLKMRLFAACNVATPYPLASFSGISGWNWRMDADFERDTPSKLTADANDIFVHTVTDTVDGETVSFTEFVIPISDMNTQELAAWVGNEKKRSGLIGELIGYDTHENAVFVLQIEGFTIRNRVAGLGDPTAIDQEVATRSQTLQMIQVAVSASAATKQDKLTSANAGTNISIDENGIISNTYSLPSATTGSQGGVMLATAAETISGSNATKAITPAAFTSALSGDDPIIEQSAIRTFQSITELGSASNALLKSGGAYRLSAVSGNHYLTVPDVPANKFGTDAHLELFVGNTSLVHVSDPLILMDALIPNAVNDCVIKFRDGTARMFVEDHAFGYVVTVGSGTSGTQLDGSLYYGLSGSTAGYVTFTNAMNGSTCDLGGAITNGEKRIVGNGYSNTVISGNVSCTNKTTFSNLGMQDVSVLDGTATLGDAYIPSGSTVAVSGGGLAVERVTGDGGTIDLGSTCVAGYTAADVSGVTITNGYSTDYGGAFLAGGRFANVVFSANSSTQFGNCVNCGTGAVFDHCVFSGNAPSGGGNLSIINGVQVHVSGCTSYDSCFARAIGSPGDLYFHGSNVISGFIFGYNAMQTHIESGAIMDFTGNPGNGDGNIIANSAGVTSGGVVFAPGGATVYPSAGSASAYTLGGVTVPQLGTTNIVNLNGTPAVLASGGTAFISGCTITNGTGTDYGAVLIQNRTFSAVDCEFSGNGLYNAYGGAIQVRENTSAVLVGCTITGNTGNSEIFTNGGNACVFLSSSTVNGKIWLYNAGDMLTLAESNTIGNVTGSGSVTISSGASVTLTYQYDMAPSGGFTLYGGLSDNLTTIIGSGGASRTFEECEIHGSTVTNLGLIYGATVYPGQYGHDVTYTEDGGTTSSSTLVGADSSFVVPGGLMKVEKYD